MPDTRVSVSRSELFWLWYWADWAYSDNDYRSGRVASDGAEDGLHAARAALNGWEPDES